jgi:thymidylate synthase
MLRRCETIHQAYQHALTDLWFHPDFKCAPRGIPIREILNYTFTVLNPVAEPIITHDLERNKVIADYTAKEVELYNSCSNRVEDFAKASKFWEKIKNPDNTINSAYGYLIWKNKSCGNPEFEDTSFDRNFGSDDEHEERDMRLCRTPWEWAKQCLIQDKDTRQAILRFSLPEHSWLGVKDFTCTIYGIFIIREDKLHFTVRMRSNDLMKGLVYDLSWFVSLMDKMIEELKPHYPNLTKGNYTHSADSMHIYEKDGPAILKMLGQQ